MTRLTPYPFQEADIEELLRHNATGFVVAETGAGKSLIAIETGLRSGAETILVVAVRGTIPDVWVEGIRAQDPDANVQVINGDAEGRNAKAELEWGMPGWYIVTPQLFTLRDWTHVRPDLAIVDEAHLLGNRDGKGSKKLRKLKAKRRMVMSGTMVRNKAENFWPLLRWVYPHLNEPYQLADIAPNRWVATYMATKYSKHRPGNIEVTGELVPGRIAGEIPCYIQHFKRRECCAFHPKGFLEDLPEPIVMKRVVDPTPAQKRAIARMEKDYIAWLDGNPLVAKLPIVARTRLRQMALGVPSVIPATDNEVEEVYFENDCESPIIEDIFDWIEEHPDEQVLFITSSQKFASVVTHRLKKAKYTAFEYSGQATGSQRDRAKQQFREGKLRFIVGITSAIGTGVDGLQHATNILWEIDESDDLTDNIQAEGRLDRRGQSKQVVHIKSVVRGTMSEKKFGQQLAKRMALAETLQRKVA